MSVEVDRTLRLAWESFCDELKSAGDIAFRPQAPTGEVDRAGAIRLLSRNIALALAFKLENADPAYPMLMHYFDPFRKQGGDNSDALYVGAPMNGVDTYRLVGRLGSARYFAITVVETGPTPYGGGVAATVFGEDIETDSDGRFSLVFSPQEQPGHWIKTTPNTFRVTVRQFFADWEHEEPMEAHIERVTGDGGAPQLSAAHVASGLADAAAWLKISLTYWADMIEKWKRRPNHFLSYRQLDDHKIDATPGGEPLIAYWQLPPDEVLIVRVVPPPTAKYWAVEFGNYWWETMDYRFRLANTNCHYARLEPNGELIIVVSHEDPGVPNWLDPSGHSEGYLTVRWMLAETCPIPQCQQMKRADLARALPAGVARITPEARALQIAARRRGVARRFKW
jgi:hypothetical protein